jgi:hypothetical protein
LPFDRLAARGAQTWQGKIERRSEHGTCYVRSALEARNRSYTGQFIHQIAIAVTLSCRTELVTAGRGDIAPTL